MTVMMFSVLPNLVTAQEALSIDPPTKKCSGRCFELPICPTGCTCAGGYCKKFYWSSDPNEIRQLITVSDGAEVVINLAMGEVHQVAFNVYDVTGHLVKTLNESWASPEGYQFEWDKTDIAGESVSPGMYILKLDAGPGYAGTQKRFVIN